MSKGAVAKFYKRKDLTPIETTFGNILADYENSS